MLLWEAKNPSTFPFHLYNVRYIVTWKSMPYIRHSHTYSCMAQCTYGAIAHIFGFLAMALPGHFLEREEEKTFLFYFKRPLLRLTVSYPFSHGWWVAQFDFLPPPPPAKKPPFRRKVTFSADLNYVTSTMQTQEPCSKKLTSILTPFDQI